MEHGDFKCRSLARSIRNHFHVLFLYRVISKFFNQPQLQSMMKEWQLFEAQHSIYRDITVSFCDTGDAEPDKQSSTWNA